MERFANTPRTEKIEPRPHFGGRGYFLKLIDSDYRTMIFPLSTIRPFSSSVKLYMPERKRPPSTDTLFFPASTVRLSTIRPAASDMYRCRKVLPPAALNSMVMASLGPARVGNTFMDPVFCTVFNPVDSFVSTEFLTLFFDSKADFQAYMLEDEDGEFMEAGYQFKDHEVRKLLEEMLEGKSIEIVTKVEQRQVLKVLKQNPNIGLRQLARITGISLGIIHRL